MRTARASTAARPSADRGAARTGSPFRLVVIGGSAGGVAAVIALLEALPPNFPLPIVLVEHVGSGSTLLATVLQYRTRLRVSWAADGVRPEAGNVYVAPPDAHLLLDGRGALRLRQTGRLRYCRPAIDALFVTAATSMGDRTIGVLLSGMGTDGAIGVMALKGAGATVLAQSPASCQSVEMPSAAIDTGHVDFVMPVPGIAAALVALAMVPGAAGFFRRPAALPAGRRRGAGRQAARSGGSRRA